MPTDTCTTHNKQAILDRARSKKMKSECDGDALKTLDSLCNRPSTNTHSLFDFEGQKICAIKYTILYSHSSFSNQSHPHIPIVNSTTIILVPISPRVIVSRALEMLLRYSDAVCGSLRYQPTPQLRHRSLVASVHDLISPARLMPHACACA